MYEGFFGFTERPFELTANPRFLFLTPRHREALGMLQYGFASRKGIVVLTGEAGTGKTTTLSVAMAAVGTDHLVAYVNNPTLTRDEFVETMTTHLGLPDDVAGSKARFLHAVEQMLADRAARGQMTALVIDEAHSLPNELIEEVRLLANIERPDQKLLTVVLVGQPELATRLNEPGMRQLKQRVALRCQLQPLSAREASAYMAKRIRLAGGDSMRVLTREAVDAIYEHSAGIPRTINVICDNAFISAFAQNEQPVSRKTVLDVCRDLDLTPSAAPLPRDVAPPARHAAADSIVAPPTLPSGPRPEPPARANVAPVEPTRAVVRTAPTRRAHGSMLDLRPLPVGTDIASDDSELPDEGRSRWSTLLFWRR